MGEGSGGSNTADSYIGSLISLTSKSEIRYEGILYTVDTENSNIALQNVRSYGTEGRKKDGPQIVAGDKVYDYIIFRGSDIKDLQVKSSPAVQSPTQPPSDPAIISLQSQYTQSTTAIPPAYIPAPPLVDGSPSSTYSGVSGSSYRGGVHSLYQAAGSIGSWGLPPPGSSGTGLAVPLYWQGYYRPSTGQTHIPHQHLLQPPPSLPAPPHLLQLASRSYPRSEVSPGSGGTASDLQACEPYANSLPAPVLSTPPSALSSGGFGFAQGPSTVAPVPPTVASGSSTPVVESFADTEAASGTFVAPNAVHGVSAVITPAAKIPRRVVLPLQHAQMQSLSSVSTSNLIPPSVPALSTTNTVLSPRSQSDSELSSAFPIATVKTLASSRLQKLERKLPDNVAAGPQSFNRSSGEKEHQQSSQPLLPLPVPAVQAKHIIQRNGSVGMCNNYTRRSRPRGGSGKGVVLLHATQHFTEDFDFMAMNKKFNKDEVWGELGGKGEYRERVVEAEDEGAHNCGDTSEGLSESHGSELQKKPVYVKGDFFDSISCDALDREGGRAERTKFSEQRKIDTETFGNFPLRSRAGRGRGVGRRGGYRGAYYSPQYTTGSRSSPHVRARGTA